MSMLAIVSAQQRGSVPKLSTPHTLESVLVCLWAVCLPQQLLVGLKIILTQRVQTPVRGGSSAAGMRHTRQRGHVCCTPPNCDRSCVQGAGRS